MYKVLVIGKSWHGSDCTGLARGFRDLGCAVELVGSDQFFPKTDRSLLTRSMRRLLTPFYRKQFNRHIMKIVRLIKPDLAVVFKGNYVKARTLEKLKASNLWLVNFYPDVSFTCHSAVDVNGFQFYDHIFTTKSFGIKDFKSHLGLSNVTFVPHGCDPCVHRPLDKLSDSIWDTDVSFIGAWSPHKESLLKALRLGIPDASLKVWGDGWHNNRSSCLEECIVGTGIFGDFYAMAINASRINLSLLQEKQKGASSGDLITARTFHIPASGGFMLHERTGEVIRFYEEGKEIECFSSEDELVDKVKYYLENETERKKIAQMGYERCMKENRLSHRAAVIIKKYEDMCVSGSDK